MSLRVGVAAFGLLLSSSVFSAVTITAPEEIVILAVNGQEVNNGLIPSKKNNYQSYTTNNQKGSVRIEGSKIKLPKVGFVKIKLHQAVQGVIKSVTISKNPSGKYYISILTQQEIAQLASIDKKLGIDLGLKNFAITSDGDIFENPKFLRKTEKQLTKAQRELSRKKKGSNNRYKARLKVAKLHEKIANQRKDFLHKLSTKLIRENQTIVMEDLSVKNICLLWTKLKSIKIR